MTVAAILPVLGGRDFFLRTALSLVAAVLMVLFTAPFASAQEQMLLESDNLVYDYDLDVISAVGNVVVRYRGYVLTTDRLTYFQTTDRLVAVGHVHVVDARGNVYEATQLDVTEDFADGFIEQLIVTTADRTFFTAESARRYEGRINEFYNSTYTACEPRSADRERPPLWNVRASRIVHDEEEEMVYFHNARLEFFGLPVAYLPYLATPDPDVERATGFLFPDFSLSSTLGFGVGIPFFWAIAPNYDLTITPTYYRKAGFLTEIEWRHRTANGRYMIEAAGVYETAPVPGTVRGGVRTTGSYDIGRFWSLGWDGTVLSDRSFASTYGVLNPSGSFVTSEVHLTGLKDRGFVEAQVYHFRDVRSPSPRTDQARQAVVHPTIDHEYILPRAILGGELRFAGNLTSLSRGENDPFMIDGTPGYYYGLAGSYLRVSEQISWQREIIGPFGQVFTPFAFARGDLYYLDLTDAPPGVVSEAVAARAMAGVGVEWAWPILITMGQSRHILEPIVQFIARPGEQLIGALPNEDAQSLVLDTTNLLKWDRFSGYDRVEGGSRLTLALRYNGEFGRATIDAIVGQSFHLAGTNSFTTEDIRGTGIGSGLDGARSDLVAAITATGARGNNVRLSGRFDGMTYELEHAAIAGGLAFGPAHATAGLAYDRSRFDLEGTPEEALTLTASAGLDLGDHWSLNGGFGYDFITGTLVSNFIGVTYECDCARLSINYSESRSASSPDVNRTIMFGLELRTLGDFTVGRSN